MSDNKKVLTRVHRGLKKVMKHVSQNQRTVLSMMIMGLIQGKKAQLMAMSLQQPVPAKVESTQKRFHRFVKNENVQEREIYEPVALNILHSFPGDFLPLAFDGSKVGEKSMALMIGIVFQNRLLPLAWHVGKRKKGRGHFSAEEHLELLEYICTILPQGKRPVLLGDGEFSHIEMTEWLQKKKWDFALRTAKNNLLSNEFHSCCFQELEHHKNAVVQYPKVFYSHRKVGPFQALVWWEEEHEHPIYLLSSFEDAHTSIDFYRKRAVIETFFSDQKSRGFHLCKTRLMAPERICRLLLSCCLAYVWIIQRGFECLRDGSAARITSRTERLSLFQLGLKSLQDLLNRDHSFVVSFVPPYFAFEKGGVMQ